MNTTRRSLPVAFAVGALALLSAGAHAADRDQFNPVQLDPITVSAPSRNIVGRDEIGTPIEEVTTTARVQVDRAALTTEYGVLMLNYSVLDAARKACNAVDSLEDEDDDDACVQKAVQAAKPQIDAAIARAQSSANS
ncbi:MAG TPA: UrcA family protein [Steroidobacteraceae bacterium]